MSKKFFIDCYTSDSTVYELTGTGNVTDTYNGHGVTSWIVKECAFSPSADDLKYGVCNYVTPTTPSQPTNPDENPDKTTVHCEITYKGKNTINAGGNAKTLTAVFTDDEGNVLTDIGFTWSASIIEEFSEFLHSEAKDDGAFKIWLDFDELLPGNYIKVFINDSDGNEMLSETFEIGGVL